VLEVIRHATAVGRDVPIIDSGRDRRAHQNALTRLRCALLIQRFLRSLSICQYARIFSATCAFSRAGLAIETPNCHIAKTGWIEVPRIHSSQLAIRIPFHLKWIRSTWSISPIRNAVSCGPNVTSRMLFRPGVLTQWRHWCR
jgi:hypothetical protein